MNKTKFKRVIRKRGGKGRGLVNSVINNLPFELHLPGFSFCGPGTKLKQRLERGDVGINPLDEACKDHDIAYHNYKDLERRHAADLVLLEKARERLHASDASFGEKSAAAIVKAAMTVKRKIGGGVKKKSKKSKKGGFLFPLLATALTAFKTYKDFKNAKKMLANQQTHHRVMEQIARKGKGLYLRPYEGEGAKKKTPSSKKKMKNGSTTDAQLKSMARNIPNFRGVYMIDQLPKKANFRESAIVNLQKLSQEGSHWVCYRKIGRIVEYFDSFGNLRPPRELEKYFRNCQVYYNRDRYQQLKQSNCGQNCIRFLKNKF